MAKRAPRKGEGRPTKYSESLVKKAREYFMSFLPGGDRPADEVIPSVEGLSLRLGIARETIYEWASQETKVEFSDIVRQMLACQGKILLNGTLTNTLNSNVGKAILSKHGYVEKSETDVTSQGKQINGVGVILSKAYGDDSDEDTGDTA